MRLGLEVELSETGKNTGKKRRNRPVEKKKKRRMRVGDHIGRLGNITYTQKSWSHGNRKKSPPTSRRR